MQIAVQVIGGGIQGQVGCLGRQRVGVDVWLCLGATSVDGSDAVLGLAVSTLFGGEALVLSQSHAEIL